MFEHQTRVQDDLIRAERKCLEIERENTSLKSRTAEMQQLVESIEFQRNNLAEQCQHFEMTKQRRESYVQNLEEEIEQHK